MHDHQHLNVDLYLPVLDAKVGVIFYKLEARTVQ
jgi:hypothetical protein